MSEEFDFESIKNKALEQLKAGKPLLGKDGAFAPLLESILNPTLEGEMDAHLSDDERISGNHRNDKTQKQVPTSMGEVTVSTLRDRNSPLEPQFIKKREPILAEGVADRIMGLYALGNSTPETNDWMEGTLSHRVSAETIRAITDRVLPKRKAGPSHSWGDVYPIGRMNAIHYKVTGERGGTVTRTIHNVVGIDKESAPLHSSRPYLPLKKSRPLFSPSSYLPCEKSLLPNAIFLFQRGRHLLSKSSAPFSEKGAPFSEKGAPFSEKGPEQFKSPKRPMQTDPMPHANDPKKISV